MTTSGTVGQTQYPVNKIIEQACRRCGVKTPDINAEMLQVGRDNLFLMLSSWANRGISLWEVREVEISLVAGQKTYEMPAGTVDIMQMLRRRYIDDQQNDINVTQLNFDDYTNLPNKEFLGNDPLQYWYDRRITPRITLWPVPNEDAAANATLIVWYHRQIEDVGAYTNTLDIPQRWIEAVVTGLAARMAMELPGVDMSRIALLNGAASQSLQEAEGEETDGAPIYIAPNIRAYTR